MPTTTIGETQNPQAEASGELVGVFYGQLSGLLKAGMPMPNALRVLANESRSPRFRLALERAAEDIENGTSPGDAFKKEQAELGGMLGRISAGAALSNQLPSMLSELSQWTLQQERLRRRLVDALTYPLIVLFCAALLNIAIQVCLNDPDISSAQLFKSMDLGSTYGVSTPTILANTASVTCLLLVLSVVGLKIFSSSSRAVHRACGDVCLRLPLIGAVARPLALCRFCGAVSILTKSGTPFPDAIEAGGTLTGFNAYERASLKAAERLRNGEDVSELWHDGALFPQSMRFIVASSVERGDTPQAFAELADLYRVEIEGRGRLISLLVPPSCLLVVGAIVALTIWGILYPLTKVMERIGG
jgi:type IV pilus assembly protein PilC